MTDEQGTPEPQESADPLDATFTAPASGAVTIHVEARVKASTAGSQVRRGHDRRRRRR